MKHILIHYLSISIIALFGYQDLSAQAPIEVQTTFDEMYPGEDDPDWHLDDHGNYEANFKIKGEKYRADYHPSGYWIETENSIKKKNLPKAVKKVIKRDFKDEKITEVEFVRHYQKGAFYDVEFKRKGKNMDVMFREDGTIID